MPLQIIYRVICSTQQGHIGLLNQISGAHRWLLQLFVTEIPHFFCCLTVQYTIISEVSLQLQMAPVKQRISNGLFQCFSPFLKFFPIRRISCNIAFFNTIGTHLTPFVMVSPQPDLSNIFKLSVLCDFLWVNVAMIVQNRNLSCKFMV